MFGWLGVGKEVGSAAAEVIGALGQVIDDTVTSDQERAEAKLALTKLLQEPMKLQALQNQIEAQHRTVFVAGWRPAVGWVCALALLYNFIGHPLIEWAFIAFVRDVAPPPPIDIGHLVAILLAMLGMAGYRTVEKAKGVAR